jgi:hypothetical protein
VFQMCPPVPWTNVYFTWYWLNNPSMAKLFSYAMSCGPPTEIQGSFVRWSIAGLVSSSAWFWTRSLRVALEPSGAEDAHVGELSWVLQERVECPETTQGQSRHRTIARPRQGSIVRVDVGDDAAQQLLRELVLRH